MNSMATLLYLLALILYIRGRLSSETWVRGLLWSVSLAVWILAIETKEIAVTLPVILFLYEWFFLQDLSRNWLRSKLTHIVFVILLLTLVAHFCLGSLPLDVIGESYRERDFTMGQRVLTQSRVVVLYLSLLVLPLPSRLNLLHPIAVSSSPTDPITTLLSFIAIFALLGLAVAAARKHRILSFCILWFFIHLAIESSIIGLEMVFEHRLYLPMVGFSLLTAVLLSSYRYRGWKWQPYVAMLVVLLLGIGTVARNRDWQDRTTLWKDVISKNPKSFRAYYNLASEQRSLGRTDMAVEYYNRVLTLKPDHAQAHNNLGYIFYERGHLEKAAYYYYEALRIRPQLAEAHHNLGLYFEEQGQMGKAADRYREAISVDPDFAEAHNNIGGILLRRGSIDRAVHHYGEALRINPGKPEVHNNIGVALEAQGKLRESVDHYLRALGAKPDYEEAYLNLGVALTRMGQLPQAVQAFVAALEINPENAGLHNNFGVVLARQDKAQEAIKHFTRALEIDPEYADAHNNLGIALAGQGQLQAAIQHFSNALRNEPDNPDSKHNLQVALAEMRGDSGPRPAAREGQNREDAKSAKRDQPQTTRIDTDKKGKERAGDGKQAAGSMQ